MVMKGAGADLLVRILMGLIIAIIAAVIIFSITGMFSPKNEVQIADVVKGLVPGTG